MTQYLLSVHHSGGDEAPLPQAEMEQSFKDVDAFNSELQASGNWVFAGGLHAPSTATVVRIGDDNSVITTDGPYAETKEHFGGFSVVDVPDDEQARYWAAKIAVGCGWPMQVQQLGTPPDLS